MTVIACTTPTTSSPLATSIASGKRTGDHRAPGMSTVAAATTTAAAASPRHTALTASAIADAGSRPDATRRPATGAIVRAASASVSSTPGAPSRIARCTRVRGRVCEPVDSPSSSRDASTTRAIAPPPAVASTTATGPASCVASVPSAGGRDASQTTNASTSRASKPIAATRSIHRRVPGRPRTSRRSEMRSRMTMSAVMP